MFRDLFSAAQFPWVSLPHFVIFKASFAIVWRAGRDGSNGRARATTGPVFSATPRMGFASIWLPAVTRNPCRAVGMVYAGGGPFLRQRPSWPGGFAEAGAALIFLCRIDRSDGGDPRALGRIVAAIPKLILQTPARGRSAQLLSSPAALALGKHSLAWFCGAASHGLRA